MKVYIFQIYIYSYSRYWTETSLQLRLMRGVFSNANNIYHFLMIFPRMSLFCNLQSPTKVLARLPTFAASVWEIYQFIPLPRFNVVYREEFVIAPFQHCLGGGEGGGPILVMSLLIVSKTACQRIFMLSDSGVLRTFVVDCSSSPILKIRKKPIVLVYLFSKSVTSNTCIPACVWPLIHFFF